MLTEIDIDLLMQSIQSGKSTYLYYVAHMVEPREGLLDEHIYKSSPKFKVIRVKVNDIQNAYFEYLNFIDNPNNYHIEAEKCYYDWTTWYTHFYTVPNTKKPYTEEFNPRMPSIIYGYRREILDTVSGKVIETNDPSPVKVQYVNSLSYGEYKPHEVTSAFEKGKLDWKYKRLSNKEMVDDIEYQYITSDWYILDIEDFPRVEKPLVNVKQHCAYFRELNDAFNYIDQLKA